MEAQAEEETQKLQLMKNFKEEKKIILILLAFNRDSFEPGNALKIYEKKTHHLTLPSPTTYGSFHFLGEDSGAQSGKRLAQAHNVKPGAGARDGPLPGIKSTAKAFWLLFCKINNKLLEGSGAAPLPALDCHLHD